MDGHLKEKTKAKQPVCAGCGKAIGYQDSYYECRNGCCVWCEDCGGQKSLEGHGGKYGMSSKASKDRIARRLKTVQALFNQR